MSGSGIANELNASSGNVSQCRRSSSELKWNPNDQCAVGYKGPLCMICDSDRGFLRRGENCEYCSSGKSDPVGAIIFLIVASFILMVVVFGVASHTKHVMDMDNRRQLHELDRSAIKILIGYMQILSVMTQSFSSTSWPDEFTAFSTNLGFVNFDLGFMMPFAACTLAVPFNVKLIIHLITPIAFLLAIQIGTKLAIVLNFKGYKSADRTKAQGNVGGTVMINLCLLMYPGIATVSCVCVCLVFFYVFWLF